MRLQVRHFTRVTRSSHFEWFWLLLTFLLIVFLTTLSPAEHSLGTHIRIVYLHGAWVWASLVAFFLAGVYGGLGLITRSIKFHSWSNAFGRTGMIFWITYLPMSLLAMQSNWNGLFLAEPRWKLALGFAISGLLLQAGLSMVNKPWLTSLANIGFIALLTVLLQGTANVMHPQSPILTSQAWRIQLFFFGLLLLSFLAVWQVARWWFKNDANYRSQ
jgi:hypothetical protein